LNTVQQVATQFDGLQVHSWPDDELIRATSGQLQSKLKGMKQAVSPEAFSHTESRKSPDQTALTDEPEQIQRLI
jgi:hypothetical protein